MGYASAIPTSFGANHAVTLRLLVDPWSVGCSVSADARFVASAILAATLVLVVNRTLVGLLTGHLLRGIVRHAAIRHAGWLPRTGLYYAAQPADANGLDAGRHALRRLAHLLSQRGEFRDRP